MPNAYYNEWDAFPAQWTRNLIDAGHLPKGFVDERSVTDVTASNLSGYTECHFFSGIGGWPLALQLAGWNADEPVWSASLPCQPWSNAGRRRGVEDERHLWPVFRDLVAECLPPVIFGEQVSSKAGREWLAGVRSDLETLGYAVGASVISAGSIGAPHIRSRIYWVAERVAHAGRRGVQRERDANVMAGAGREAEGQTHQRERSGNADSYRSADERLAHADSKRRGETRDAKTSRNGIITSSDESDERLAHAPNANRRGGERSTQAGAGEDAIRRGRFAGSGKDGGLAHAAERGLVYSSSDNGEHASEGRPEWDATHDDGLTRQGRAVETPWADAITIECSDGKTRRVSSEPSLYPLADGLPGRVGRLRAYGNAIVPQVAAEFIRAYLETRQAYKPQRGE